MCKTFWRKNDASIRALHALAHQEGNKPDLQWPTLSKFLNTAGIFLSCFLLDAACISKEGFFIKGWNVFWQCSCGNRYSFTKSKRKNIIED